MGLNRGPLARYCGQPKTYLGPECNKDNGQCVYCKACDGKASKKELGEIIDDLATLMMGNAHQVVYGEDGRVECIYCGSPADEAHHNDCDFNELIKRTQDIPR